jgi:lysozyme
VRALRVLAFAAAVVVIAVAVGSRLYRSGYLRFNYPSRAHYPIQGVDVSHHQGAIDWPALRGTGVDFAFIKVSEGGDHTDTTFAANWETAGAAGVRRGAYHFFTFCTPGGLQARHFVATIAPLRWELPPAADVEFSGNCQSWSGIDEIRVELRAFLDAVEEAVGQRPLLYVDGDSHRRIIDKHFPEHPLWVRDLFFEPRPAWYGKWRFWQFADNARLAGVEGPVDLDAFCCSRAEFDALLRSAQP